MKQTPLTAGFNPDLLSRIPQRATRVIEVGCGSGALAKAYLEHNPACEYIGIEVDRGYAEVASVSCTRVIAGDIEKMDDSTFATLFPCDCWVLSDVLEHLYDPWSLLRRMRTLLAAESTVVACIPNAQHWTVQAKLNHGAFRYEESGLMDLTHIRWFTQITIVELFQSTGFRVIELAGRVFDESDGKRAMVRDRVLGGIRALALSMGTDPEKAASNACPLQWVVVARVDVKSSAHAVT